MNMIPMLALALMALLTSTSAAGSEVALPKELPPFAPDRPLPGLEIDKKTLANGLEIWVVPRNGLPRVDAVLAVRGAGRAADPQDASGFADVLAGLLTEGTQTRNSRGMAEAAQALGGSVRASASADGITVSGNALASRAPQMLELVAEIARMPSFPESEVHLARANALQGLRMQEAQPAFQAERAMSQAIYGSHPYARTTLSESGIDALTPTSLKAAHAARFRPDRSLLVVAGRITAAEAFSAAEAALGTWRSAGTPVADTAAAPRTGRPAHLIVDRPGSAQTAIRLGRAAVSATDADFIPLQLATTILGGSFSSRLMQNLREDKAYTYGARGELQALRAGGRISASADVRNEVTGAALKELLSELARMGYEPVSAQELEDAKRYVAGGYLINNQMQAALASTLASNWLAGLPVESLGQYVAKIRAVGTTQVQTMGRKYFDPGTMSIVLVGDSNAIASQLTGRGAFEQLEP